jgi:glycosyltransferase involved in cell wall biosynthesis
VAIGRLSHEKGFDLLLAALSRVDLHDWAVEIFGEGPCRNELERQCLHLGLSTRVTFKGWTENPANELDRAGLFVMPSRHEGFPNVLLEALARGVPVISFDCPSGPRHIIRNNEDGLLVPAQRVDLLAAAISRVLEDPDLRQTFSENALNNIRRFEQYKIEQQWLDTLWEAADTRATGSRP